MAAFVTNNQYVPMQVTVDPNGRIARNPDAEYETTLASERNFGALLRRQAYERLGDSGLARSNPNFDSQAAGRLMPTIAESRGGNDPKILRGYIRRSTNNATDPTTGYRLYFMFNPETITRDFVSYLDQAALDPFNTIFDSNNLVLPPGVLDFSFDLMFDRQSENARGLHDGRGVLVDYDYFDLVIRGVIPDGGAPQLQDSGIMIVNPRNITVVFGPQLSVQGRPYRANVTYTKFDHKMNPIRMVISLSMKAFYFGPVREDFTFANTASEGVYTATVPYDESVTAHLTTEDLVRAKVQPNFGGDADAALTGISSAVGGSNGDVRLRALAKAKSVSPSVNYTHARPPSPGAGMDCSGLVCWSYAQIGAIGAVDSSINGYTGSMLAYARNRGTLIHSGYLNAQIVRSLQPGDLVLSDRSNGKTDHVAFIESVDASGVNTVESTPSFGGPTSKRWNGYGYFYSYNYVIRPAAGGTDTVGNV